jgi:hypothetical protein
MTPIVEVLKQHTKTFKNRTPLFPVDSFDLALSIGFPLSIGALSVLVLVYSSTDFRSDSQFDTRFKQCARVSLPPNTFSEEQVEALLDRVRDSNGGRIEVIGSLAALSTDESRPKAYRKAAEALLDGLKLSGSGLGQFVFSLGTDMFGCPSVDK